MSTWILVWSATILADVTGSAHVVHWNMTHEFSTREQCVEAAHNVVSRDLVCDDSGSCDQWLDAGTLCAEVSK